MERLDPHKMPRHVAIIMDGNGRWAKKRFLNRIAGHEAGAESVRTIVEAARRLHIPYLTLYAFSKENWQRPRREIEALWRLLTRFLRSERPRMIENEIRLCHVGDKEGLPSNVLVELQKLEEKTAHFQQLVLNLAINYGGRQEIVRAARLCAKDVLEGRCEVEDITPERIVRHLHTSHCPDPDLLIRTSGESRISNFLLWQLAYTEIYITDVLWPDFREPQFIEALLDYQRRERRFGKTSEQIRGKE